MAAKRAPGFLHSARALAVTCHLNAAKESDRKTHTSSSLPRRRLRQPAALVPRNGRPTAWARTASGPVASHVPMYPRMPPLSNPVQCTSTDTPLSPLQSHQGTSGPRDVDRALVEHVPPRLVSRSRRWACESGTRRPPRPPTHAQTRDDTRHCAAPAAAIKFRWTWRRTRRGKTRRCARKGTGGTATDDATADAWRARCG